MPVNMFSLRSWSTSLRRFCLGFHCSCSASQWRSQPYTSRSHFNAVHPLMRNHRTRRNISLHRSTRCVSSAEVHIDQQHLWLPNDTDTYMLGYLFGTDPHPSDVLLLHGPLGAGKTSFARGYIQAATQDKSLQVTSPTFLLTNTYTVPGSKGPLMIYHMDLWRLSDASERPIVDFEKVFGQAVSLIEWPDRLNALQPSQFLDVYLEYPSPSNSSPVNENDPWGFESDNKSLHSGRYARLIGHGDEWLARLRFFYDQFVRRQSDGQYTLTLSS